MWYIKYMNIAEYKEYIAKENSKPQSKWRNQITEYNGRKYHSKKEAEFAKDLDIQQKAKEVIKIEPQVPFILKIGDIKMAKYVLDFRVTYKDGSIKHYDVKGAKQGLPYDIFVIKKKLMKVIYDIEVIEV
jgi:hypothetical protein